MRKLEADVEDRECCHEWQEIKRSRKTDLAAYIEQHNGIIVNPDSLFHIQAKRIHEYKRQHLNILYIITLYNRIKANPQVEITPQTFIFGGKAAPSYQKAKLIIKLINSVAEVVNNAPDVSDRAKRI